MYPNLPSAVHGKENVLYMAAQELLSLPTGTARIAYVGPSGRTATYVRVPQVHQVEADDETFVKLRTEFFERSCAALPMSEAVAALERRELRLIAEAKKPEPEEPKSFRVAASAARSKGRI